MEWVISSLVLIATLGSGLIAGTFFIFSAAIIGALRRMAPGEGVRAMQSINLVILNPLFLGVFLGTAVLSLAIAVLGVSGFLQPGTIYLTAGSAVYVLGSLLVTILFNVPLNNALAEAKPGTPEGEAVWQNYLRNWTYFNHVRTIASVTSTALFIIGLSIRGI